MTQPFATSGVDLSGRRALVTGAGSGIGAACARRLAAAGAQVVVLDLSEESATRVAQEVGGTPLVADLSDEEAVARVCASDVPGVDIVVNNAGLQHVSPLEQFPPERFALILKVMLEAPFRLVQAALPHMYAQGWGRVVNMSSAHGLRASAHKSAYVAAKHGLEGLSKVIALEGAAHGVTSNTICPGYVRTPLVEGQIAAQAVAHGIPESEVVEKVLLSQPAIKRLIEPSDVAEVAAFLCSDAAAMVTGSSYVMDGGWSAR